MSADPAGDGFRAQFAQLVSELLSETHEAEDPISAAIQEHLGSDGRDLPIYGEELPSFELANLQLGLDAALARTGFSARVLGVAGQGRRFSDVSLSDLITASHFTVGPPDMSTRRSGRSRRFRVWLGPCSWSPVRTVRCVYSSVAAKNMGPSAVW